MNRTAVGRCALAAVLFGLSAPAASRLTREMGSFVLAGLLYVGAALAVAPLVAHAPPTAAALGAARRNLGLAVVLGGGLGPLLLAAGLARVPAATSSLLLNLELVFTTLVASLLFREHVGRAVMTGTGLVVVGSAALGWSGAPDARWGAVLVAAACLCWAVDNSAAAAIEQLSPAHITFVKGVAAGGTNLAIGLATSGPPAAGPLLAALAIGAVGYGASITLWVSGARELGAARAQLVFATAPFVGAVAAWTFLDESPTTRGVVAFVLGLAGVSSVLWSAHTHPHTHADLAVTHRHAHVPDQQHRHEH